MLKNIKNVLEIFGTEWQTKSLNGSFARGTRHKTRCYLFLWLQRVFFCIFVVWYQKANHALKTAFVSQVNRYKFYTFTCLCRPCYLLLYKRSMVLTNMLGLFGMPSRISSLFESLTPLINGAAD